MAEALKAEGNKLFQEKRFEESVEKFTQAIELDPQNHVLYSNRSGAYASLKAFDKALEDANKVVEIKPDWVKGHTRRGAALHGNGDLPGALRAYEDALKLDPTNAQAKSGVESVKRNVDSESGEGDPMSTFANIFSDPQLITKLASNPKTSPLLADAEFMGKLQKLSQNPKGMNPADLQDPRILQVFAVLMGLNIGMGGPGSGAADFAASQFREEDEDEPMPDRAGEETLKPEPVSDPEPEEDEEAKARKEAKARAEEEKRLGTESYKKREFDSAVEHYSKAWEMFKDITYLNNLGAAYFEKKDYQKCVETCQLAVTEGREVHADFKLIAKAFARVGAAYEKLGDLANAIVNYQNSLTEHRTPEVLSKLRAAEKAKASAEKLSHISPEKAEEARELGNEKFKAADWPAAVEAYTEMIKCAPDDPRGYSNRAACFIKLLSFPSAVQDCDAAIQRDPTFIRAHLRKAQALFAMREYNKCLDACNEAAAHDVDGKNAREIDAQQAKAMEAQYSAREGETEEQTMERIQRDPDIVKILQDPVMQSILQQAKSNPAALQEHMKNPQVRQSVQKLLAAGVIRLGR